MNLTWLENLTKPFASLLNPMAERIGNWIGRRKPNLYVHFEPTQTVWCIANNGASELMQAMFWADFNHDDPKETLVIVEAYPDGTLPQLGLNRFAIPPRQVTRGQVAAFVLPIKGDKGKPWFGRFVLIDQFKRKYKTQKATFRWGGPPSAPTPK